MNLITISIYLINNIYLEENKLILVIDCHPLKLKIGDLHSNIANVKQILYKRGNQNLINDKW